MDKRYSENLLVLCSFACIALCIAAAALAGVLSSPATAYAADSVSHALAANSIPSQPVNGIPALSITLIGEDGESPDEALYAINNSFDHSVERKGTLALTVPEEYKCEFSDTELADLEGIPLEYMRGRGNSTWYDDKKPYKLKLDEKTDLCGMGSSKHWVLLANAYDESLLRNRITSYIGRQLGLEFTPKMTPVDLYVNGNCKGSYVLCPQVRVDGASVNVDELGSANTIEPEITGGYLLGLHPYPSEPMVNTFKTSHGVEFLFDDPAFDEEDDQNRDALQAQRNYISSYLQKTEDALFADDMRDENGVPYSDYMDLQSAASYWWVQEFSANGDGFITPSTYLYKKRGGKLYWGPLWDFDMAYDDWLEPEEMESLILAPQMRWLDRMRAHDATYQQLLRETWGKLDNILLDITKNGGVLDQYASEIKASWIANAELWDLESSESSFNETISKLKGFLANRRDGVNAVVDEELTDVYVTVQFVSDDKVVKTVEVRRDGQLEEVDYPPIPVKDGYYFLEWRDENGDGVTPPRTCREDLVAHAAFIPDEEAVRPSGLFFSFYDVWVGNDIPMFNLDLTIAPENVVDKRLEWTSSDPSIAAASGGGVVRLDKKTGTTTITCTASNGLSSSLTLHVYDANEMKERSIEDFRMEQDSLALKIGEYGQVRATVLSQPTWEPLMYESSDSSIADTFGSFTGVVRGIAPGTCTISVRNLDGTVERQYTVTVTDASESEGGCDGSDEPAAAEPGYPNGTTFKSGGSTYRVTSNANGTVALAKAKNAKSVKVPATIKVKGKTYKVTSVAARAFKSAKKRLVSVTLGRNVASIGANAFAGCAKLKRVKGGKTVKAIGRNAFAGCKALSLCAPLSSKKLAKLGPSSLRGCKSLKSLTIKSKKLTKKGVRASLKGSSVKTVKVKIGKAKMNRPYAAKYAKFFAKPNCGKKVKVKA